MGLFAVLIYHIYVFQLQFINRIVNNMDNFKFLIIGNRRFRVLFSLQLMIQIYMQKKQKIIIKKIQKNIMINKLS